MMGTGEASGEGRAMAAAEAAIANPLLDETSMRGAKGLLISITGGRDMTLFEVDEAATRIREEVDSDANIILGATFDEELEGLIRVSVVATGIDREVGVEPVEYRHLRTNTQQMVSKPAAVPEPIREEEESVEETFKLAEAELEQELNIAVPEAAAVRAEDEFRPQSRLFTAPAEPRAAPVSRATPQPVAPAPMAEIEERQPELRRTEAPKMPRIEDFPPMVRAEVEHNRRPADPSSHDERGPMGLLKRISSSLGRREDEEQDVAETAGPRRAAAERRPLPPEASMYAPRRAATETQARPAQPPNAQSEEDQLEIPAFLRRQALWSTTSGDKNVSISGAILRESPQLRSTIV